MSELRFLVPDMSCRHCADAIAAELSKAPGIDMVHVDIGTKWVVVRGRTFDVERIRAATAETGHRADL